MKDGFEVPVDPRAHLHSMLVHLSHVNFQLAELKNIKEVVEEKLLEEFDRIRRDEEGNAVLTHEGTKQHYYGSHKITIKTDYIYTLDKDEYSIFRDSLPERLNPVEEKVKFEINKRLLRDFMKYASDDEKEILDKVLSKRPGKPNVKVEANV